MKRRCFNYAIIIALITIGFTIATKASLSERRNISACFTNITLGNTSFAYYMPPTDELCDEVKNIIATNNLIYLTAINLNTEREDCYPSDTYYCCARFELASPFDPFYPNIPYINLNDGQGPQKWVLVEILCRPE